MKIAITKLSILLERQLAYLLNPEMNKIFPPFLNLKTPGLNLGMQGMQFVATSTVAENQSFSMPISIHSISTNNNNQDVVSMGMNAVNIFSKVVENTFQVLTIQAIAITRAVHIDGCEEKISKETKSFFKDLASVVCLGKEDSTNQKDLENIKIFLKDNFSKGYETLLN